MENHLYHGGRDQDVIQLFAKTFTDSEGAEEGKIIGDLVTNFLKLTTSEFIRVFVTHDKEELVAALIFSKMSFDKSEENVWLLSPMAVATAVQGKGIGQRLIQYAHEYLRKENVSIAVTYGDINFYSKVGYQPVSESVIPAPLKLSYPEGWIAQSLIGEEIIPIQGKSYCAEPLNNPVYW